ncbi:hypothetical protein F5J12DRAFT_828698 [Pisolithus orientalis]|uniref:uncharacterized protein n=1 Tax=Pisolithus orientalis TaxID=936130 RepID=UPI002224317B|nr:uncharacterized protein F5J12DRAFT_828698 [Pisolithus orientalis]KAI6007528.1 hypothetical protein F5J12DRAFT_828698 [Pisolithus orientalis]
MIGNVTLSNDGGINNSSDHNSLLENDSSRSSPHEVPELEAYLYYFGLRGPRHRGPKLIFRTSKDVFPAPSGPEQHPRHMKLRPVYDHHILGKGDLWPTIRSEVVRLLDRRNIQFSSVDLVRFSWVKHNEENEDEEDEEEDKDDEDDQENEDDKDDQENEDDEDDQENEDDEDDQENEDDEDDQENEDDEDDGTDEYDPDIGFLPPRTVVTTPVTIWVGVLPDTLTGEVAFKSSNDILDFLKEHGISDVDVAYRESVANGSSGPELFAPVWDFDPLKAVIDPVTTSLSLPIAGFETLYSLGKLGFYFKVGQDLYAVTARHVLFPENEGNNAYSYVAGPKKEVVLMGSKDFNDFLASIQDHIDIMNHTVGILERRATTLTARAEGDGPTAKQAAKELEVTRRQLPKTRETIEALKNFFVKMKTEWTSPKDRIIGHVVWAPPVSVHASPHSYTLDVCVIELDKKKFLKNCRGNVLDLGPEIGPGKFISLMYPPVDASSDFDYPVDRLLKLRGILSAEEIRTPNNRDREGDPMRYVIKRGLTTLTTIGCLNGFESHVRRYCALGSRDSVEVAVYPYDTVSGPFSRGGDSGSIIVDALGKFVALLTGGTGPAYSSEITFGTPMHWLWDVIKTQFPGANLYFEDDND